MNKISSALKSVSEMVEIPNRTEREKAWAAGLWDGEGCCFLQRNQSARVALGLAMSNTDEKLLQKFHKVVGVGQILKIKAPEKPNHSQQWQWRARGYHDVWQVIAILWDDLSDSKRKQIEFNFKKVTPSHDRAVKGKTSLVPGVSWHERSMGWQGRVIKKGITVFEGVFDTESQAALAVNKARKSHA